MPNFGGQGDSGAGRSGARRGGDSGGGREGGRAGGGEYRLGFRPGFKLTLNGEPLLTRAVKNGVEAVGYHAAISRVECVLGIDQVNTLTITFVGEESALLVKEKFDKKMPVTVAFGYDDYPDDYQLILSGHALQARPQGTNPVEVDVEVDSLMYQAREDRNSGDNTDPNQAEYIANRLFMQEASITTNLGDEVTDVQTDEGGSNEGDSKTSLLDFIQRWSDANQVHWIDLMNGEVKFFYPGAKVDINRPWQTWRFSVRGGDDPAVLTEWSPRTEFVDAPRTIVASYYDSNEIDLRPKQVKATNPHGIEDTMVNLGLLIVKDHDAAQAIVDAAAEDYYWHTIRGGFALSAGVPVMPLDDIIALNGPPGLEEYYDRPFEVVRVRHVFDARGWRVNGEIRGGRA